MKIKIPIFGIIVVLLYALSATSVFAATTSKPKPVAKPKQQYTGIYYYREGKNARASLLAHPSLIDVWAPQTYSFDETGALTGTLDPKLLAFVQSHKIKIMPLVTNAGFSKSGAHDFLDDPARQERAIAGLIAEAQDHHFWGWQIDFEQVDVSYRDKFSAFVARFGSELKAHNLISSVAVIAQVSENPGDYPGDLWKNLIGVYDYKALASSTDFLSIMSYDDPESKGPIARYSWLERVLAHSMTLAPKEKLSLGVPFYYWQRDDATQKIVGIGGYEGIKNVLKKPKVLAGYSKEDQAPFLRYTSKGKKYTLWYENGQSINKKIELVKSHGLHGISAWALGLEVPSTYKALATL